MQILFKTQYNDDIRFLAKTGEKIRVGLVIALLAAAPLMLQDYYLAELGLLLVYVIAAVGLMILTGHTGQARDGCTDAKGLDLDPLHVDAQATCRKLGIAHGNE